MTPQICAPIVLSPQYRFLKQLSLFRIILRRLTLATRCFTWNICPYLTGQVAMNGTGTRTHSVTPQICAPIVLSTHHRSLNHFCSFWIIMRQSILAARCFTWNIYPHLTGQVAMNWSVLAQILWFFRHGYLSCFPRSTDFLGSSAHFESYWGDWH